MQWDTVNLVPFTVFIYTVWWNKLPYSNRCLDIFCMTSMPLVLLMWQHLSHWNVKDSVETHGQMVIPFFMIKINVICCFMNFSELHFLEFTPSHSKWDEHKMNIWSREKCAHTVKAWVVCPDKIYTSQRNNKIRKIGWSNLVISYFSKFPVFYLNHWGRLSIIKYLSNQ